MKTKIRIILLCGLLTFIFGCASKAYIFPSTFTVTQNTTITAKKVNFNDTVKTTITFVNPNTSLKIDCKKLVIKKDVEINAQNIENSRIYIKYGKISGKGSFSKIDMGAKCSFKLEWSKKPTYWAD